MAWKNFQNGYPLYASELNNYLMNQAVVVFASAAERDSVLTSPVEGQVVWLQDTNAFQQYNGSAWVDVNDNTNAIQKSLLTTAGDTIYATGASTPARLALGSTGSLLKSNGTAPAWLGVGTSGQVLSSTGSDLAWATPATGGKALLSTTTASGTSTTVSSINQTYKTLEIVITGLKVATTGYVLFSMGPNGYPQYAAAVTNATGAGTSLVQGTARLTPPSTYTLMANSVNNSWSITVDNYTSSTLAKPFHFYGAFQENNYTGMQASFGFGQFNDNSGILESFKLESNQSFTAGTIKIYGVN